MKHNKLLTIFLVMFKIGCITYGGGWSIIVQMEEEFVDKRNWLTKEDILDFMSLARSFPGVMIVNYSVMAGYKMAGIPGAFIASMGLSAPAFITLSIITYCYNALVGNFWVERALTGVRCAIIPILIFATKKMWPQAMKDKATWVIAAASLALCVFNIGSKIMIIIAAALVGLILYGVFSYGKRKDGEA